MENMQTVDGRFGLIGRYVSPFSPKREPTPPLIVSWWLFAGSIGAFVAHYIIGGRLPFLASILAVMSLVTCGLAWLLAQALFRDMDDPHARFRSSWSVLLVGILFTLTLGLSVTASDNAGAVRGYFALLQSLIGSAVLVMTLLEAFDKITQFNRAERFFRIKFAAAYAVILGSSFVVQLPEFMSVQAETQAGLALLALVGAGIAVRYRLAHPLASCGHKGETKPIVGENNPVMAKQIETLLQTEAMFTDPDVRLPDLARRLREPSYKISRCITHDLEYRNFNHMVNFHRIEAIKACFDNPDMDRLSILSIAMDCGFASIGPFNRAFKMQTGLTPSTYRRTVKP